MEMFQDECEELSLLDIVIVLAEQKKLIAAVTLIFALAGLAYALLFTKPEYKSEIQMMTVNSRITGDGELSVYLPGNMIDAVVSSNAMRDAVISEFNLTNVDGKEISKDAAQRSLEKKRRRLDRQERPCYDIRQVAVTRTVDEDGRLHIQKDRRNAARDGRHLDDRDARHIP